MPVEQKPLTHPFDSTVPSVQSSKPEDVGKLCQYFSLLYGLACAGKLKGTDKLHPKEVLVLQLKGSRKGQLWVRDGAVMGSPGSNDLFLSLDAAQYSPHLHGMCIGCCGMHLGHWSEPKGAAESKLATVQKLSCRMRLLLPLE